MTALLAAGSGLGDLFAEPFMRHAFLAGVPIAALSGLVGYLVVLRSQVFTGDALSHVAFTGALGALAFGLDARLGLFVCTVAVGIGLGLLGSRGRADDVVIGTVFAWVLGLGVLALSVYATSAAAAATGASGVSVLFGSVLGLSAAAAWLAAGLAVVLVAVVLLLGRPLLFASLDEAVASARCCSWGCSPRPAARRSGSPTVLSWRWACRPGSRRPRWRWGWPSASWSPRSRRASACWRSRPPRTSRPMSSAPSGDAQPEPGVRAGRTSTPQCSWRCQSRGTRPAGPGAGWSSGWLTGGTSSGPA